MNLTFPSLRPSEIIFNLFSKEKEPSFGVVKHEKELDESVDIKEKSALIFIHGFQGHIEETWGDTIKFLMLDSRLSKWVMYPFGYSTGLMPNVAKKLWTAMPDIITCGDNLRGKVQSLIQEGYGSVSICAHSMGGLATQSCILSMTDQELSKLHSVVFFGTPSRGLRKAILGKFINDQVRDLSYESDFIKDIRVRWNEKFKDGMSFHFRTVAGDKDYFVTRESSLEPFDKQYNIVIGGNHVSMVKPRRETDQTISTITDALLQNINYVNPNWEFARLAVEYADYKEAIVKYDITGFDKLNVSDKVNYILAKESLGLVDEAVALAEKSKDITTDTMGVLGGRFKRLYLLYGEKKKLDDAKLWYKKGLDLSVKDNNHDQIYYHAINMAFLSLISKQYSEVTPYAEQALESANKGFLPNLWQVATIAEAYIYLKDPDKALEHYAQAFAKAKNIQQKDSILLNALESANIMGWTDDQINKLQDLANQ